MGLGLEFAVWGEGESRIGSDVEDIEDTGVGWGVGSGVI